MRLIGLTGGIATGKSTVAALLAEHGAAVIDADLLAREVVAAGSPALGEIVAAFGAGVLGADGALDRAALAGLVFGDRSRRRVLEAITHPRINELMAARVAAALAGPAPLVVADVPLLFEGRRQSMFEGTLLAYAPAPVQLRRIMTRDGIDEEAARARLDAQLPIDDKRSMATWVVDNSGTLSATAAAVGGWWEELVPGPPTGPSRR